MYFYTCTTYDVKKTEELRKERTLMQKSSALVVGAKEPQIVTVSEEATGVSALVVESRIVPDAVALVGDHVETVLGEAVVVEVAVDASKLDLNKMTKTELFKLAAERGVEVEPSATRNELVKILSNS